MDIVTFHSWWTVSMLVIFIGIIMWAWSGKRRRAFDEAARLALEDDEVVTATQSSGDKKHG